MYQGKFLHEEPPKKKRKRLPVGLRIILWTMCVMVVLAASAYAYLNILLGKIDRSNISGNAAAVRRSDTGNPAFAFRKIKKNFFRTGNII